MASPDKTPSGRDGPSEETSSLVSARPSSDEQATIQGGQAGARTFSPGQVVADRYRIVGALGEGGMGEVWHAFDLKLRVDVALKTLHRDAEAGEKRLEAIRREVRSARDVVSPNVCRVFDLEVVGEQEFVSMEYVDGETLIDVLRARGPLELGEASEIASQFLAGLSAIHDAGLVHRDIKPENIMITRAGRVVIMDFGLAKLEAEGSHGTVSGTPAYMPPEQRRGEAVDARADIFSAGVVLAEMLATDRLKPIESRKSLLAGVHQLPPRIPGGPWKALLERAVAADPNDRYRSVSALARALEEITLRVEGAEDKTPYPGLSSFTEDESAYFFGREAEIEALWKKLKQPHLLGLIGPSGAGKSSFLRAGLIAHKPEGWKHVICHPGDAPFRSLAKALVPQLAGDTEAMQKIVQFDDADTAIEVVQQWCRTSEKALMIIDQFEELFTLNPDKIQDQFAQLIGRLPIETDVHVLLSIRDDFLFHCSEFPALAPVFSELSPLRSLTRGSLRRALVQPALACGYRFEDDSLVDEMVAQVADERGALPLLAFAASRLWETRHRETGTLTREAYGEIGGVAGSLAQHAEATMERLGEARRDTVREIFRNLVTAEGTRAVREMAELLSVFENGEGAREVLAALIDARLLTSYEVASIEGTEPKHQVEIVHESLLEAWPRLVRWRTQDEDSAHLRDQLRQAAKLWDERDRSEDLLWSGSAYFDYRAWRERYQGGLSDTEEAFSQAMVSRANRQRRRRRVAVGLAFGVLSVMLGVFGWLWRQSEKAGAAAEVARQQAVEEARRAEASKLLALGRLIVEDDPSSALAYALASLELADDTVARLFVQEVLWAGPTRIAVSNDSRASTSGWQYGSLRSKFTRNGDWLVRWPFANAQVVELWSSSSNSLVATSNLKDENPDFAVIDDTLITRRESDNTIRFWSIPDVETERSIAFEQRVRFWLPAGSSELYTRSLSNSSGRGLQGLIQAWPLDGSKGSDLGTLYAKDVRLESISTSQDGRWFAYLDQGRLNVWIQERAELGSTEKTLLFTSDSYVNQFEFDSNSETLAIADEAGHVHIRHVDQARGDTARDLQNGSKSTVKLAFDPEATSLASIGPERKVFLWDLLASADAEPTVLIPGESSGMVDVEFGRNGRWLATSGVMGGTNLWPLVRKYPRVIEKHSRGVYVVKYSPDGEWIASGSGDGEIWLFPTGAQQDRRSHALMKGRDIVNSLDFSSDGREIAAGFDSGLVGILPVDGGEPRWLGKIGRAWSVAFGPTGRLVAAVAAESSSIHVWNLTDGTDQLLHIDEVERFFRIQFLHDGSLVTGGEGGVRLWDLENGTHSVLHGGKCTFAVPKGERSLYTVCPWAFEGLRYSLGEGTVEEWYPNSHGLSDGSRRAGGDDFNTVALDPTGRLLATAGDHGVLRVGPIDGGTPHLLYGHTGPIWWAEFSPDSRWIATAGDDGIRIWPVPEGRPFHTLPYDELLDSIRALTNLRVIENKEGAMGYHVEAVSFPGWEHAPTW